MPRRFAIAFSLPGEAAERIRPVAEALRRRLGDGAVFFYPWFGAELSGLEQQIKLINLYRRDAELVVAVASGGYDRKLWTAQVEAPAISSLRADGRAGDVMIVWLDGDKLDWLLQGDFWLDARALDTAQIADAIAAKVKEQGRARAAAEPVRVLGALPQALGEGLKGRDLDLSRVRAALVDRHAVSLWGEGGIGKSRLAAEYARRFLGDYPRGVFFAVVRARQPLEVWAELGRQLEPGLQKDEDAAERVLADLSAQREGAALVVLDDVLAADGAEPDRFAQPFTLHGRPVPALPASANVHVLLTTRLRELPGAQALEVERLDGEAALALLLAKSKRPGDADARALADADLGGHALAVSLAGAYLAKAPSLSFAGYRARIADRGVLAALEDAARRAGKVLSDHDISITATIELSRAQLDGDGPAELLTRRTLAAAAQLAPGVTIDRPLLFRVIKRLDRGVDPESFDLALDRLAENSLLALTEDGARIHALVADFARRRLAVEGEGLPPGAFAAAAVDAMSSLFPDSSADYWRLYTTASGWERMTPERQAHVEAVLASRWAAQDDDLARLAVALGELRAQAGSLNAAAALFEQGRRLSAAGGATTVGRLAVCLRRLGVTRLQQGRTDEALAALREAQSRHQEAGEPEKAASVQVQLARIFEQRGELQAALAEIERLLVHYAGPAGASSASSADRAVAHDDAARLHLRLGRRADAIAHFRSGAALFEAIVAERPDDLSAQKDLGRAFNNLAMALLDGGQSAEAAAILQRAIELVKAAPPGLRVLVDWQMAAAAAHGNLGLVRRTQGDLEGAVAEQRSALAMARAVLAADPSSQPAAWLLADVLSQLADTLSAGAVADARAAREEALAAYQKIAAADPGSDLARLRIGLSCAALGTLASDPAAQRQLFVRARDLLRGLAAKGFTDAQLSKYLPALEAELAGVP